MTQSPTLEAERAAPELPPLPKPARRSAAPNFIDLVDYYTAEQVRQAQREARAVGFDEGWQAGRRAPRPPGPAQSALPPKQSIDTPEFRELLQELWMCMGSTKMNKIAAKIIAYIDGRTAGTAPEGWKLVPIEPTEEMDVAARAECHRMKGVIDPVIHVWDAMIAAAPSPLPPQEEAK